MKISSTPFLTCNKTLVHVRPLWDSSFVNDVQVHSQPHSRTGRDATNRWFSEHAGLYARVRHVSLRIHACSLARDGGRETRRIEIAKNERDCSYITGLLDPDYWLPFDILTGVVNGIIENLAA